jgi:hypothetical protein
MLAVEATPVAHYTTIGTLSYFIPAGAKGWASAWATPVQFLNDRMELALGLRVLDEVANHRPFARKRIRALISLLRTSAGRLETDAFQMSFSGDEDELGQWRGYGANGMGCAVVTDAIAVSKVADVAGWVIYDTKKQKAFARKVLEQLRHETDNDLIERVIVAAACFMKQDGFGPEKEFRLLKFPDPASVEFRQSGDRMVPYVDYLKGMPSLPIHRIVIGPSWQLARLQASEWAMDHVVQGIHRLLTARGLHTTTIEKSNIPYDPR